MFAEVLACFPAHTWPLTLAYDPDALLAEESVATELQARGFRIIDEPDPVALRLVWSSAQPVTEERPVILVTGEPLSLLPDELRRDGHAVELLLDRFFPTFDLPTLRLLTPNQRARLADGARAPQNGVRFSPRQGRLEALRVVFSLDVASMRTPGDLVAALASFHRLGEPLPHALVKEFLDAFRNNGTLGVLPLEQMLSSADAFRSLVAQGLAQSLSMVREPPGGWGTDDESAPSLSFATDASLQAALGTLMQTGFVAPQLVDEPGRLPAWARGVVVADEAAARERHVAELLRSLDELLSEESLRWEGWRQVAALWAQITRLLVDSARSFPEGAAVQIANTRDRIDAAFLPWLQQNYSTLSGRRLPDPHHLFHIPGVLANRLNASPRVALLVLDGMSLAMWQELREQWQVRHSEWHITDQLVLAQIPTLTSVSRQALIAGRPPRDFAESLDTTSKESRRWRDFWVGKNLSEAAIAYEHISARSDRGLPVAISSSQTKALCLVVNDIDDMVHGATQGLTGLYSVFSTWLNNPESTGAVWIERIIQNLLENRYLVAVTSDHGHVEALGIGTPSEGLLAHTRAKRARIYPNTESAQQVRQSFPDAILWENDALLPPDLAVLFPSGRQAFAEANTLVVSHGGPTIEEVIVPFATIEQHI